MPGSISGRCYTRRLARYDGGVRNGLRNGCDGLRVTFWRYSVTLTVTLCVTFSVPVGFHAFCGCERHDPLSYVSVNSYVNVKVSLETSPCVREEPWEPSVSNASLPHPLHRSIRTERVRMPGLQREPHVHHALSVGTRHEQNRRW